MNKKELKVQLECLLAQARTELAMAKLGIKSYGVDFKRTMDKAKIIVDTIKKGVVQ